MGIMFSRNMYDSVARNNIVSNEDRGIVVSESDNNEIHNNTVLDSGSGIDIDRQSSQNTIRDNIIVNIPSLSAVKGQDQALKQNSLYSNAVITSDEHRINLNQEKSISNATSNITGAEPLRQVSVDRTINVTEPSNPIMDAFYYLFGWK
jgi:parallel beta-helix repeat protein